MTAIRNLPLGSAAQDRVLDESPAPISATQPLARHLLPAERDFYRAYPWSLNAYPTVACVVEYLRQELNRLDQPGEEWQLAERRLNVFLLSCAIANEVADYLPRSRYDFAKLAAIPLGGLAVRASEKLQDYRLRVREWRLRHLSAWNERWLAAIDEFLQGFVSEVPLCSESLPHARTGLAALLRVNLPAELDSRRLRNPAFFHVRDLTHLDVLKLGNKFATAFPDRGQPILLVGLRTAGSYFGPLLLAHLRREGYRDVRAMTIRPSSAVAWTERAAMTACARAGRLAVVLDEPPCSGGSTANVARILCQAGFAAAKVVALFPVTRLYREWRKGWGNLLYSGMRVLTLEPEEWHKQELLGPETAQRQIQEYFRSRGYVSAKLVASANAERFNRELRDLSDEKMHTRLKQIYEVHLQKKDNQPEIRYVLAKSVGWGWLGYHAFLAGKQLGQFLPPILGLRNGILYTEWLPVVDGNSAGSDRCVQTIASYVANRVRRLGLSDDPSTDLVADNQHKGYQELASLLGRAFGSRPAAAFKRPRIQHELARQKCPVPTLIDAKMRRMEWVAGPASLLKVDFEHHAMGKRELEITDPAYDLADAILHFGLSEANENELIERYAEESGDLDVGNRLFLYKLLAGTWSMLQAQVNLKDASLCHRCQEFNRRYLEAWEFLTLHSARHCAKFCYRPRSLRWRVPLLVLDVDGVLDRNVFFSFPSTTAAGLKAISLLHRHDFAVALNSARSVYELKEYCQAYGFLGGVAEYGSALWNAVTQQETVLVDRQALGQLEQLRGELRKIPGVFLNDRYQYSIRAYTFGNERTMPLPTPMILGLIHRLNGDQLKFHQTELDTAVLAKEIDKGAGLTALLAQTGVPREETIAVGDSEPDLDMFRVAGRSFAPSHIRCRDKAEQLGCQIACRPCQPGLLEIARRIAHPGGKHCERCGRQERAWRDSDDLFMRLLEIADHNRIPLLIRSLLDPMAIRAFAK